jgi:hypothetical protein
MRYIGGVAGATVLSALMRDASSPASHQRPVFVYAGALVVAVPCSRYFSPDESFATARRNRPPAG